MSHPQGRESETGQSPAHGSGFPKPFKTFCNRMTSWRYRIPLLLHVASALIIVLRMNISLALVCMIRQSANNDSVSPDGLLASGQMVNWSARQLAGWSSSSPAVSPTGEFEWESSIQSLVLSSGRFIAFLTPLFVDVLSRLMGAKRLMTVSILVSGVLTVLNPLAARTSPYFFNHPANSNRLCWWISVGNILIGGPSGYMCSIPVDNGWPFIFYVHGGFALVWCVLWHFFATVRPDDHPFISEEEKTYIVKSRLEMNVGQEKSSPPYLVIAKSKPVWGYVILMSAYAFGTHVLFAYIPKYMSSVFHYDSEEVGLITSATYAVRIIGVVVFGFVSNLLFARTHLGKTTVRKIVQCSGLFLSAAFLFALGFLTSDLASLVSLNFMMLCHSSTLASGFIVPLDMAPRYSGFISGAYMTISGVVAIPGPIAAGFMTPQGTLQEWRNVFILVGACFFVGGVSFLVFGSSELQPWAIPQDSSEAQEKNLPVTFDLINRRMTIMSIGPPISPKIRQNRFRFDTTLGCNFHFATYSRSVSQGPNTSADGSLVISDLQNKTSSSQTFFTLLENHVCENETTATTKGLSCSVNITQVDVTTSDTSQDYANLGFTPDQDVISGGKDSHRESDINGKIV